MAGVDTEYERKQLEYRPHLRYELPPAVENVFVGDEVAAVVAQTSVFDPQNTLDLLTSLQGEFSDTCILQSLDVVRYLLDEQKKILAPYDYSQWASLLSSRRAAYEKMRNYEIPWEVVNYPDEYPEYSDKLLEYQELKKEYEDLDLLSRRVSRIIFSVADVTNVEMKYLDGLQVVPEVPEITLFAPGLLEYYLNKRNMVTNNVSSLLRLCDADKQMAVSEALLQVQRLRLGSAADLREDVIRGKTQRTKETADLLATIDAEYRSRLLDLHKIHNMMLKVLRGTYSVD